MVKPGLGGSGEQIEPPELQNPKSILNHNNSIGVLKHLFSIKWVLDTFLSNFKYFDLQWRLLILGCLKKIVLNIVFLSLNIFII